MCQSIDSALSEIETSYACKRLAIDATHYHRMVGVFTYQCFTMDLHTGQVEMV